MNEVEGARAAEQLVEMFPTWQAESSEGWGLPYKAARKSLAMKVFEWPSESCECTVNPATLYIGEYVLLYFSLFERKLKLKTLLKIFLWGRIRQTKSTRNEQKEAVYGGCAVERNTECGAARENQICIFQLSWQDQICLNQKGVCDLEWRSVFVKWKFVSSFWFCLFASFICFFLMQVIS